MTADATPSRPVPSPAGHPRPDNGVVAARLRFVAGLMAVGVPRWEVLERAQTEIGMLPATTARYVTEVNRIWLDDAQVEVAQRRGEARARTVSALQRAMEREAWSAIAKLNDSLCRIDGAYMPTEIAATIAPAAQAAEFNTKAGAMVDAFIAALAEQGLSEDTRTSIMRRARQLWHQATAADEAAAKAQLHDGGVAEHAVLAELAALEEGTDGAEAAR